MYALIVDALPPLVNVCVDSRRFTNRWSMYALTVDALPTAR